MEREGRGEGNIPDYCLVIIFVAEIASGLQTQSRASFFGGATCAPHTSPARSPCPLPASSLFLQLYLTANACNQRDENYQLTAWEKTRGGNSSCERAPAPWGNPIPSHPTSQPQPFSPGVPGGFARPTFGTLQEARRQNRDLGQKGKLQPEVFYGGQELSLPGLARDNAYIFF